MEISPEIQALINRGNVEIREFQHLTVTKEEAHALIPALTNSALARRLDRTLINIKLDEIPESEEDMDKWMLYWATDAARKYLEKNYKNPGLAAIVESYLAKLPDPGVPDITYWGAMYHLAQEAARRIK